MTKRGEALNYYRDVVLTYEGDECLTWPYNRNSGGYGQIRRDGRMHRVSRLVCKEEHGPAPTPVHETAHSCGNGHLACVAKRHLSWKTSAANKADKLIHGTHNRGARHGMAKLTEPQARTIMALKGQMTQREIGRRFGVSDRTIGKIHRREKWAWLLVSEV